MTKAEQASALRELNRRNHQLWQTHRRIFEQQLDKGKLRTPDGVLRAYKKATAKAVLEEVRDELHSQQRENKRQAAQLAAAALFKKYRSPVRMVIQEELIKHPKATDLEVCRALDNDERVASNTSDRLFRSRYRVEKGSGSLHSTISQVRSDLRGRRART